MEKHQFMLMLEKFNLLLEELAEIRSRIIDVETAVHESSMIMQTKPLLDKIEEVHGSAAAMESAAFMRDQMLKTVIPKSFTDTELISFLEEENKKCRYTGNCIFRLSTTRRGWRLHETSKPQGHPTVREAITRALLARDWSLHRGKKEEEGTSHETGRAA